MLMLTWGATRPDGSQRGNDTSQAETAVGALQHQGTPARSATNPSLQGISQSRSLGRLPVLNLSAPKMGSKEIRGTDESPTQSEIDPLVALFGGECPGQNSWIDFKVWAALSDPAQGILAPNVQSYGNYGPHASGQLSGLAACETPDDFRWEPLPSAADNQASLARWHHASSGLTGA